MASSLLAPLLDKHAAVAFDAMTPLSVRDVLKELSAAAGNDAVVGKEVTLLTAAQQDTLMKIIYVGLASDAKQSSAWFKWHAALHQVAGAGAIVRTLTDITAKPPTDAA